MRLNPYTSAALAIICCAMLSLPGYAQRVIKPDTSNYQTIRIDPNNAMGGNAADVFDEVSYIPLETTPESLFGRIYQLEIIDDHFVILDQNTSQILIFTKAGKFRAKIKGKSEGGRLLIWSFHANRFTNQIVFSDDRNSTQSTYDLNGKLVKTEVNDFKYELPSSFSFVGADKKVETDMYRIYSAEEMAEKPYSRSLIRFITKGKVYASAFTYKAEDGKKEESGPAKVLTFSGSDTVAYYSRFGTGEVFTITPNTVKQQYQFIFPLAMTLPANFQSYNDGTDEWYDKYMNSHKDQIYRLSSFYRTGDNLWFNTMSRNFSKERDLIYNLKTGTLLALQHISTDESTYFLPLFDEDIIGYFNPSYCDGSYVYNSYSSLDMFKAIEKNAGKKIKYPPILAEYLAKGNKKSNPVIVQFKVKDQL